MPIKGKAKKFQMHKYRAKQRGNSGHWHERGIGSDKYCMARFGDTGPYAVGNVHIALNKQNSSSGMSPAARAKISEANLKYCNSEQGMQRRKRRA